MPRDDHKPKQRHIDNTLRVSEPTGETPSGSLKEDTERGKLDELALNMHNQVVALCPIKDIRIASRLRNAPALDEEKVRKLAQSIVDIGGLLNPITVSDAGALVAGRYRLEAFRKLGYRSIPCFVVPHDDETIKLAEIDENLRRVDLSVLEQAEHLLYREKLLEERGRRAHRGRPRHQRNPEMAAFFVKKTTGDLAADVGVGERTVRQRLQIAKRLLPELRDLLRSTPAANATRTLLGLARLDKSDQQEVARTITSNEVRSVAEALRKVKGGKAKKKNLSAETVVKVIRRMLTPLSEKERDNVFVALERWIMEQRQAYQEPANAAAARDQVVEQEQAAVDRAARVKSQQSFDDETGSRTIAVKLLVLQWKEAFRVLEERGVDIEPTDDSHFLRLRHNDLAPDAGRILEREQKDVLERTRGSKRFTEGVELLRGRIREILPEILR